MMKGFLAISVATSNALEGRVSRRQKPFSHLRRTFVQSLKFRFQCTTRGSAHSVDGAHHFLTLQILSLKDNNLTGTLPESMGDLTDLTEIMLQNNNFRWAWLSHL